MHLISRVNTIDKRLPLRRKGEEQLSQPSSLLLFIGMQLKIQTNLRIEIRLPKLAQRLTMHLFVP
jgi:hypothetical protein